MCFGGVNALQAYSACFSLVAPMIRIGIFSSLGESMKPLFVLLLCCFSLNALASFSGVRCSDGKRSVFSDRFYLNTGSITFTTASWDDNGNIAYTPSLHVDIWDTKVKEVEVKELYSREKLDCVPGSPYGHVYYYEIHFKKLRIEKKDGSPFPKNIVWVSEDLK